MRILKDLSASIEGRHVLIVEDIIDTGLTLNYLLKYLADKGPASVRIVCLLDKPARRLVEIPIDYRGFTIPELRERLPKAPVRGSLQCSVGLDTLIVDVNGDAYHCDKWAALGNLQQRSIRELWRAGTSRTVREGTVHCTRGCTENCAVRRPLSQRVRGALQLLRPH